MFESSQTPLELITAEINLQRNSALRVSDLSFSPPELINPEVVVLTEPKVRNTQVTVHFAGDLQAPEFTIEAFYNRLQLARVFSLLSIYIPYNGEPTLHALLPKLNEIIRYQLTEADVIDVPLTANASFTVKAQDSSYGVFGEVQLSTAVDPSPPEFSNLTRYYVAPRSASIVDEVVTLEQTTAEPIYVASYLDADSFYYEFSDLSDLTFEGGHVYAVPPGDREYTRLVDSFSDFPQILRYLGSSSQGLKITQDISELDGGTMRKRSFTTAPSLQAEPVDFPPAYYLYWIRFSNTEFTNPINFLIKKAV